MRTSADHARTVLSAILWGDGSMAALGYASRVLVPEHFSERTHQVLFMIVQNWADQQGGIISREALGDVLREKDPGTALSYQVHYDTLAAAGPPTGPEFKHAVRQLRELRAAEGTGRALAQAEHILRHGAWDDRARRELRGHVDARRHVLAALAEVEREAGLAVTAEGDVHVEGDEVLRAYTRARDLREHGRSPGVQLGLPELDRYLRGPRPPGALDLVLSWTSRGKTSACVQYAWDVAVQQRKNVVFFTTETLRDQVRCKLAARHSRLPQFGLPRGLDSLDIEAGRLGEKDEDVLREVMDDWKTGGYGHCNVVQMPDTATVSWIVSRLTSIQRRYPVDLCVVDYFQLCIPERYSRDARMNEDQSGIVKAAKTRLAVGCEVPVMSPWQLTRRGREGIKANGTGDPLEHLSQTSEAANTPDLILFLYDRDEDRSGGRAAQLELTVAKNRSGPKGKRFYLTADYATCMFTSREVDNSLMGQVEDEQGVWAEDGQ